MIEASEPGMLSGFVRSDSVHVYPYLFMFKMRFDTYCFKVCVSFHRAAGIFYCILIQYMIIYAYDNVFIE